MTRIARLPVFLMAVAAAAAGAPAPAYTPREEQALAIRAAQVDAMGRLADLVLSARVAADRTVGQALGPGGEGEIGIRRFLRSSRIAGESRYYSDGVAEVDVEMPRDAVVQALARLHPPAPNETLALPDLDAHVVDGCLRASGSGRAPEDIDPLALARALAARVEDLPEMFPAGWERVTASGRVVAVREARVRAYRAMADRLRAIQVGPTRTVGDLVGGIATAEANLDVFIRNLPVAGAPRLMPDRIAEVDVTALVRDVIRMLKEVRAQRPSDDRWTEEQIDHISVNLKADRLTVTGSGMPPADDVRPVEPRPEARGSLPDWAANVLQAQAAARFSDDAADEAEARLLASRSAKARALANLERQLDAVRLDDGRTARERAAKEEAFRRDLKTFLSSARTALSRATEDGKGWEVALRLPLARLYEFSRPRP